MTTEGAPSLLRTYVGMSAAICFRWAARAKKNIEVQPVFSLTKIIPSIAVDMNVKHMHETFILIHNLLVTVANCIAHLHHKMTTDTLKFTSTLSGARFGSLPPVSFFWMTTCVCVYLGSLLIHFHLRSRSGVQNYGLGSRPQLRFSMWIS